MRKLLILILTLFIILAGCSRATPENESDSTAKIIIEGVFDKSTGKVIENATMIIHVEREGKEALVYEEYKFSEYVIRGEIGDYVENLTWEIRRPGVQLQIGPILQSHLWDELQLAELFRIRV